MLSVTIFLSAERSNLNKSQIKFQLWSKDLEHQQITIVKISNFKVQVYIPPSPSQKQQQEQQQDLISSVKGLFQEISINF